MGAWGEGPFESDQALDWLGTTVVDKGLMAAFRTDESGPMQAEARAAAQVIITMESHLPSIVTDKQLAEVIEHLEAVLRDREGAEEWRDPAAFRNSVLTQLGRLHGIVAARKAYKEVMLAEYATAESETSTLPSEPTASWTESEGTA